MQPMIAPQRYSLAKGFQQLSRLFPPRLMRNGECGSKYSRYPTLDSANFESGLPTFLNLLGLAGAAIRRRTSLGGACNSSCGRCAVMRDVVSMVTFVWREVGREVD